jgi:hypothetical protein
MIILVQAIRNAMIIYKDGTDSGEVQELGWEQIATDQTTLAMLITRDICQVIIQAWMTELLLALYISIILMVSVVTMDDQLKLSTVPACITCTR